MSSVHMRRWSDPLDDERGGWGLGSGGPDDAVRERRRRRIHRQQLFIPSRAHWTDENPSRAAETPSFCRLIQFFNEISLEDRKWDYFSTFCVGNASLLFIRADGGMWLGGEGRAHGNRGNRVRNRTPVLVLGPNPVRLRSEPDLFQPPAGRLLLEDGETLEPLPARASARHFPGEIRR